MFQNLRGKNRGADGMSPAVNVFLSCFSAPEADIEHCHGIVFCEKFQNSQSICFISGGEQEYIGAAAGYITYRINIKLRRERQVIRAHSVLDDWKIKFAVEIELLVLPYDNFIAFTARITGDCLFAVLQLLACGIIDPAVDLCRSKGEDCRIKREFRLAVNELSGERTE